MTAFIGYRRILWTLNVVRSTHDEGTCSGRMLRVRQIGDGKFVVVSDSEVEPIEVALDGVER